MMRHPGVFAPAAEEEPENGPFAQPKIEAHIPQPKKPALVSVTDPQMVVFDLETQLDSNDVDGWANIDKMKIAVAVVWDSRTGEFTTYRQEDVYLLCEHLTHAPVVVGFNQKNFDYIVVKGSGGPDLNESTENIDMLEDLNARIGHRVSLNSVARGTLGIDKSADGLEAVRWWKAGMVGKVEAYCKDDVEITRDIFLYGLKNNHVKYRNNHGKLYQVTVDWSRRVKSH